MDLEARLFIGANVSKTISEWVFLLLKSKEHDIEKLKIKLKKTDMLLVVTNTCNPQEIRIGRLLPANSNPWLIRETQNDINFWKEHKIEICIFSGLYGDFH